MQSLQQNRRTTTTSKGLSSAVNRKPNINKNPTRQGQGHKEEATPCLPHPHLTRRAAGGAEPPRANLGHHGQIVNPGSLLHRHSPELIDFLSILHKFNWLCFPGKWKRSLTTVPGDAEAGVRVQVAFLPGQGLVQRAVDLDEREPHGHRGTVGLQHTGGVGEDGRPCRGRWRPGRSPPGRCCSSGDRRKPGEARSAGRRGSRCGRSPGYREGGASGCRDLATNRRTSPEFPSCDPDCQVAVRTNQACADSCRVRLSRLSTAV